MAVIIAPATSPSLMSLIRDPVSRTSLIKSSFRRRSRMTTVRLLTLILFALADDDHTVHREPAKRSPHGINGGAVGRVLIATTHPAGAGERASLGDPYQFEGQVATDLRRHIFCRSKWLSHQIRLRCSGI